MEYVDIGYTDLAPSRARTRDRVVPQILRSA
jgi:hypothetical protein